MIKTKSILEPVSSEDGTRICVMRWVKPFYKYDEWLRDLAPSHILLQSYRNKEIDWNIFEFMYQLEMSIQVKWIDNLVRRSKKGEIITLLCWEKDDKFCHRRLLKEIIDLYEKEGDR